MMAAPTFGVRTRRARFIVLAAVFALVLGLISAMPTAIPSADAATGAVAAGVGDQIKTADLSQFQAGNIMSDAVFFNSGTMSAAQIQSFLEARVPRCDAGYTCLKDWYDTSRTVAADAMCGAYSGGVRERASTIIYKVAQACGINPQVILATLEKEQGLVTHVWPSDWRYERAMGQGCPDTAECDTRYLGFFNQVYGAAWQFKRYANPPGTSQYFTWYAPGQTWNVRYHPDASCGSSPVYIQNQATANLYYYTPYQPNGASLRAGYGEGDGCSSYGNRNFYQRFTDWFGSTQGGGNPFGNFESVQGDGGSVRVTGWAADPDTTSPIEVHVYVGSLGTAIVAAKERPDVGAANPGVGSQHGFDTRVPAPATGAQNVCAYAINVGGGANQLLGCRTVNVTGQIDAGRKPFGNYESLTASGSAATATGWAIDPDTTSPVKVRFTIGGTASEVTANLTRPDIGSAYPASGPDHGFTATISLPAGTSTVCATVVNNGIGGDAELGCRSVTVAVTPPAENKPPIGFFESASASADAIAISGWAIDPNSTGPIEVHVYVDGAGKAYTADVSRPDIAVAYPGYGDRHGFVIQAPASPGPHQVCIYAIDTAGGTNPTLGCRTVTVTEPDRGRDPIGNFEALSLSGNVATASGWALDPDSSSSIAVHLYVNGAGKEYIANKARPDIGAAYPANGEVHGFVEQLTLPDGKTDVCAYGINTGRGSNTFLGCRSVTVAATPTTPTPPPAADAGRSPKGHFEAVAPANGGAAVTGWALDPDTGGPIEVHVYVGSTGRAYVADKARPDVGAAYGLGDNHGFNDIVPLGSGMHRICIYAINSGGGDNPLLGCRDVTIP
ncbi:MAG: hypothetical protein ABW091_01675 [Microbacterium sp.]